MNRIIQDNQVSYYRADAALPAASIRYDITATRAVLTLQGTFSNELALELGDELTALISTGRTPVLRLSRVTGMRSSVLEQLILAQKAADSAGLSLILTELSPALRQQLADTGLMDILDIRQEVDNL